MHLAQSTLKNAWSNTGIVPDILTKHQSIRFPKVLYICANRFGSFPIVLIAARQHLTLILTLKKYLLQWFGRQHTTYKFNRNLNIKSRCYNHKTISQKKKVSNKWFNSTQHNTRTCTNLTLLLYRCNLKNMYTQNKIRIIIIHVINIKYI